MTDKKEIKKYCSGIDCLTCDETEPCIYRVANELQEQLNCKEQECEKLNKQVESLNEKLLHKRAVVEFADCPHYSYGDNTIEPTCTKNFCYDVKSCDHKNMVKYKQALDEIEEIAKHNNFLVRDPFCGPGYRDLSGQILNLINKAKEQ